MTVSTRELTPAASGTPTISLGVDLYFDFLQRQMSINRMLAASATKLVSSLSNAVLNQTALFARQTVERADPATLVEQATRNLIEQVAEADRPSVPITGSDQQRVRESVRPAPRRRAGTTMSATRQQQPPHRLVVDEVFDEIVDFLVAADIAGDRASAGSVPVS
jgi:hypothetical protein